ncbi:hypothetical protein M1D80_11765 [Phyllobacteriaceae bacterium JZ32]
MSAITGMLIGIAAQVGAPIVKRVLERQLGQTGGEIAGTVIDAIAGKLGVSPAELPAQDPAAVGDAILQVEAETPELLLANVESQKETNRLLMRQMEDDKPTWTWAWLPAWQWFLLVAWAFTLILVPIVNAIAGGRIAAPSLTDLAWVTAIYQGLHMGGNTAKSFFEKRWGKA